MPIQHTTGNKVVLCLKTIHFEQCSIYYLNEIRFLLVLFKNNDINIHEEFQLLLNIIRLDFLLINNFTPP